MARRYTDDELAKAVASSANMASVLKLLGLVARGGNYETVRRRIADLGLNDAHLLRITRSAARATDREVGVAVQTSRSFAEVLRKLGYRQGGGT